MVETGWLLDKLEPYIQPLPSLHRRCILASIVCDDKIPIFVAKKRSNFNGSKPACLVRNDSKSGQLENMLPEDSAANLPAKLNVFEELLSKKTTMGTLASFLAVKMNFLLASVIISFGLLFVKSAMLDKFTAFLVFTAIICGFLSQTPQFENILKIVFKHPFLVALLLVLVAVCFLAYIGEAIPILPVLPIIEEENRQAARILEVGGSEAFAVYEVSLVAKFVLIVVAGLFLPRMWTHRHHHHHRRHHHQQRDRDCQDHDLEANADPHHAHSA